MAARVAGKILAITFCSERRGDANKSFLMVIEQLRDLYRHEIFIVIPLILDKLQKFILPRNKMLIVLTGLV